MRFTTKMPALSSAIAAGSTVSFKLPIGRNYANLYLVGAGAGLSFGIDCLSEIRVLVNSKVIQRYSGTHRNMMNLFEGRESASIDDDNFNLVLPFNRYNLSTVDAEEFTGLNTGVDPANPSAKSINQLSVEIDIAATGFTGTPTLTLFADQSDRKAGGPGAIPYLLKSIRDFQAAGSYQISDLPRGGVTSAFIDKLYMLPSNSTLENFKIEANNVNLFERSAALNERIQRDGVRVPQAGMYVIDRTENAVGGDPFDMRGLDDWRLYLDTGAQLTLTMYTLYVGGIAD